MQVAPVTGSESRAKHRIQRGVIPPCKTNIGNAQFKAPAAIAGCFQFGNVYIITERKGKWIVIELDDRDQGIIPPEKSTPMYGIQRMIEQRTDLDPVHGPGHGFPELSLRGMIGLDGEVTGRRYRKPDAGRTHPFGFHLGTSVTVKRIFGMGEMMIGQAQEYVIVRVVIQLGIVAHAYRAVKISILGFNECFSVAHTIVGAVGGHFGTVKPSLYRTTHETQ